jgi:hypothetical protein
MKREGHDREYDKFYSTAYTTVGKVSAAGSLEIKHRRKRRDTLSEPGLTSPWSSRGAITPASPSCAATLSYLAIYPVHSRQI